MPAEITLFLELKLKMFVLFAFLRPSGGLRASPARSLVRFSPIHLGRPTAPQLLSPKKSKQPCVSIIIINHVRRVLLYLVYPFVHSYVLWLGSGRAEDGRALPHGGSSQPYSLIHSSFHQ